MSHEIYAITSEGITDMYSCVFKNDSGTIKVNVNGGDTWEAWNDSNIDTYDIPLVERGMGYYTVDFPATITTSERYRVVIYKGDKTSPDIIVGEVGIIWTGTEEIKSGQLADDGLDSIDTTEPSGRASNFREMVVQSWMRFFNKTTKNATTIKNYDASGVEVTSQDYTEGTTTDTVEKA